MVEDSAAPGAPPKKARLGRGLDAMIPGSPPARPLAAATGGLNVPIEELHPNRDQPRTRFDEQSLEELAASIRELGVLEPILVRRRGGGGFEIVAGERRWRAAQRAGLREVPVYIRELTPQVAFEAALVENLQREDLNPIETARAFQRLIEEHGHSQESVAQRVGKDRSTVANALRLLKLPSAVLDMVENGQLSEGHGRAILGAPDTGTMLKLARMANERALSVRETEKRARAAKKDAKEPRETSGPTVNVRDLEERLGRSLGAKVAVVDKKGKGRLEIRFTSYDELDRLLERLL